MDKASTRKNKSQRIAKKLKGIGERQVQVTNPFADELVAAAKHIEWLELILTGISYADRNTIVKLTRKVNSQKEMILRRDVIIAGHNEKLSKLKKYHAATLRKKDRDTKRQVEIAERITQDDIHKIEKKFIKDLQTGFQKGNALSQARWEGKSSVTTSSRSVWTSVDSTY